MSETMRQRFTSVVGDLLEEDARTVVVLAVIGRGLFAERGLLDRYAGRIIDVGIREQTQVGIAGGLALEGLKPILTGYAPFLVERTFEQIKLSITHQRVNAVLASVGASWDSSMSGRTHQAPEDVALMATLPGWTVHVPGHPDEMEILLRSAHGEGTSAYIRMSEDKNRRRHATTPGRIVPLRTGTAGAATILVVGPLADTVLAAVSGLDVTVLYTATPHPIDRDGLRLNVRGTDVLLIEPYLTGTSAGRVAEALSDRPIRLRSHGVGNAELRNYGTPSEHRTAHGLDPAGIRRFVSSADIGHVDGVAVPMSL
jgi:transketolase